MSRITGVLKRLFFLNTPLFIVISQYMRGFFVSLRYLNQTLNLSGAGLYLLIFHFFLRKTSTGLWNWETWCRSVLGYWDISNCSPSLYALVIEKGPYMIQFFDFGPTATTYRLSDLKVQSCKLKKLSRKFRIPTIYDFAVFYPWNLLFS